MFSTPPRPTGRTSLAGLPPRDPPVRLLYRYLDGHEFTTEVMLESEARAYMPVLRAEPLDPSHYDAPFATIELLPA